MVERHHNGAVYRFFRDTQAHFSNTGTNVWFSDDLNNIATAEHNVKMLHRDAL